MATISLHHVKTSLKGYSSVQEDQDALLARAGINPAVIKQPYGRVHTDRVASLFKLIQKELDDEFMGFTQHPLKHGLFNILFELMSRSNTLGDLLAKGIHFFSLVTNDINLKVSNDGNNAEIQLKMANPDFDRYHFITEYLMVIWHRVPSWFIGEAIHLQETHFYHLAPSHTQELKIMFPGINRFDQSQNSLLFDATYLDKPVIRTKRELESFLHNAPSDFLTIPGEDNSLEAQIERILACHNGDRLTFPNANELAAMMHTAPQALYRSLRKEGTSYLKIKDNIRREISIDKLINEKLSVDEVSDIVGFTEPRSFTRAFKTWTGLSPRNYCKYHCE